MGWTLLTWIALLAILWSQDSDALLKGRDTGITTRGKIYEAVCEAEDEDLIGWFDKEGNHVTSEQIFDKFYVAKFGPNEQHLFIQDVKVADGGNYTCKGSKTIKNFELYVEFYVTQFPKSIKINATQNALIPCTGIGYPPPKNRWYRDWQRKEIFNDDRFRILPNGSLLITDVKVKDASNYTCRIQQLRETQRSREERRHVEVVVFGPPELDASKSTTKTIYSYKGNKKVQIVCRWMGFPIPKKTITRPQGRGLLKDVKIKERTIFGYIETEDDDDFGEYICEASNFLGVRKHTILVNEADSPLSPSNVSATPYCRYITIRWSPPTFDGGLPITSYDIRLVEEGRLIVDEAKSGSQRRRYTFNGDIVKPATQYVVYVRANNYAKQGAWLTLQVTADFCPPSGKVEITNRQTLLNTTSFTLTWTGPADNGGDPNMTYIIEYSKKDKDGKYSEWKMIKDVKDKQYNITGLEGGNTYMFHVVAVNKIGRSEPGKKEFEVLDSVEKKKESAPRGKVEITNRQTLLNSTSFTLTWTGPEDNGGDPNMNYIIEYSKKDKNGKYSEWKMIKDVDDKQHNISGLEGGNKYMFHVVAVNKIGRSEPGKKEFEVLDSVEKKKDICAPRGKVEITNRQTLLNSTSFTLTWTGPADNGDDPNMNYIIEYSKKDKDGKYSEWKMIKDVDDKQYNITGLEGGNKYMFHVVAVNKIGRSEPGKKEFEVVDSVEKKKDISTLKLTDVDVIHDIKVNCTSMAIQVDLTLKEYPYLDLESFRLRDPSCTPHEKSRFHVTLVTRLDGCGTTNKHQNESVTYYNSVTARIVQSKSKMHIIEFPFSCTFIKRRTIGIPSFQLRKRVSVVEEGFGNFSFEMNLFKSALYKKAFDVSEYPVNVPITKKLFAQTKLLATDKNLEALTYTCVATPSPDPRDALQYLFIDNGCVMDTTVKFKPIPGVTQNFEMSPFKFREASSTIVYLHCHVMVCHKDDAQSRCHKGCIPAKTRTARDASVSRRSSIHRVTLGPINVQKESETGAQEAAKETGLSLGVLLVAIFGTLLGCLILFVTLAYVLRHAIFTQNRNGLLQKIPETEPLEMSVVS